MTLHANDAVRFSADESLRSRLLGTARRIDDAALMYGAGGFMGIAALGTALIVKRKTVWGYLLLALAALTALGGSRIRTLARNAPRIFDTPVAKDAVSASIDTTGDMTVTFTGSPWKTITLRFGPDEYDRAEAATFIAALRI